MSADEFIRAVNEQAGTGTPSLAAMRADYRDPLSVNDSVLSCEALSMGPGGAQQKACSVLKRPVDAHDLSVTAGSAKLGRRSERDVPWPRRVSSVGLHDIGLRWR